MARPKKNEMDKRQIDVSVACSPSEIKELRRRAGKSRLAVYLRTRGLDDKAVKIVPPVNEAVAAQLLAGLHKIDKIGFLVSAENCLPNHLKFWELLRELRDDLRRAHREILTYADPQN